eukprot:scaffold29074_cov109-Isochrysis_galbana.AAC.4
MPPASFGVGAFTTTTTDSAASLDGRRRHAEPASGSRFGSPTAHAALGGGRRPPHHHGGHGRGASRRRSPRPVRCAGAELAAAAVAAGGSCITAALRTASLRERQLPAQHPDLVIPLCNRPGGLRMLGRHLSFDVA